MLDYYWTPVVVKHLPGQHDQQAHAGGEQASNRIPLASHRVESTIRKMLGKGGRALFETEHAEEIPVSDIQTFQGGINEHKIKQIMQNLQELSGEIIGNGYRWKGQFYLDDGNHSVNAALRLGQKTVRLNVIDLDAVNKHLAMDFYQTPV